ncbi:SRA stem-loop-interacting RNA-binding protein, mitochondrial isoform X2 [Spea bombifrons]|uniref:SRA stem-loop-interacting RNA-binding protein, mitochondrial isoform X2 n=1 Tax=Spea bombifrons TaxID=233779 RepID=UPI0023496764|nr:SRA stem-loop-interacting RNA-binding protein, mitochondrial isoform X2 [Spea bombifrons]
MAAQARRAYELFVSQVPWTIASRELKEYFSQFGTIRKCLLPFDRETGFHRGYSWVAFTTEEGLQNALQKDTHLLEGAKLQVQQKRSPTVQTNRPETNGS